MAGWARERGKGTSLEQPQLVGQAKAHGKAGEASHRLA